MFSFFDAVPRATRRSAAGNPAVPVRTRTFGVLIMRRGSCLHSCNSKGFGRSTLRFLLLVVLTHLSRSRGTADNAEASAAQRLEMPA